MSKQLEKEEGEMSDIHALHVDSEEDQERLREFVCKSSHTSRMGCQLWGETNEGHAWNCTKIAFDSGELNKH